MTTNINLIFDSATQFVIPIFDLPPGTTMTEAMLVVKNAITDPDSAALLTKTITPAPGAAGVIYNFTTGQGTPPTNTTGTGELRFNFTETDPSGAGMLSTTLYFWAAKIKLSSGQNVRPYRACGQVQVFAAGVTTIL